MKSSEVLTKALELMDGGAAWTQNAFARDSEGRAVSSHEPLATCFCSAGAMSRASMLLNLGYQAKAFMALQDAAEKLCGRGEIFAYNDKVAKDFSDIQKMFETAITERKAAGD